MKFNLYKKKLEKKDKDSISRYIAESFNEEVVKEFDRKVVKPLINKMTGGNTND